MPQGLQVFDENGNVTVDLTDRLTKVLGLFRTGKTNGSRTVGTFPSSDFWYTCVPLLNDNMKAVGPTVSYSNGVISWNWDGVNNDPNNTVIIFEGIIIYGVY
ncbi:hypothetical protein BRC2024_KCUCJSVR_CDS_0153 [Acinetobacter phage vB_AbaM_KissB]